jgi:hypothetical protein
MMPDPIFLTACTARTLQDIMDNRASETDGAGFGEGAPTQMFICHCGDLIADGIYAGFVTLLDASTLEYTDGTGNIYLWDANGADLIPDNYYVALASGFYTVDDNTYPLYTITAGGEGGGDAIHLVRPSEAMGGIDLGSGSGFYYWAGNIVEYGLAGFFGQATNVDDIWIIQRTVSTDETEELLIIDSIYMGDLQFGGEFVALNPEAPDDFRQCYFVVEGLSDAGDMTCQNVVTSVDCTDGVIFTTSITVSIPTDWIYESPSSCAEAVDEDELPKWITKEEHEARSRT